MGTPAVDSRWYVDYAGLFQKQSIAGQDVLIAQLCTHALSGRVTEVGRFGGGDVQLMGVPNNSLA